MTQAKKQFEAPKLVTNHASPSLKINRQQNLIKFPNAVAPSSQATVPAAACGAPLSTPAKSPEQKLDADVTTPQTTVGITPTQASPTEFTPLQPCMLQSAAIDEVEQVDNDVADDYSCPPTQEDPVYEDQIANDSVQETSVQEHTQQQFSQQTEPELVDQKIASSPASESSDVTTKPADEVPVEEKEINVVQPHSDQNTFGQDAMNADFVPCIFLQSPHKIPEPQFDMDLSLMKARKHSPSPKRGVHKLASPQLPSKKAVVSPSSRRSGKSVTKRTITKRGTNQSSGDRSGSNSPASNKSNKSALPTGILKSMSAGIKSPSRHSLRLSHKAAAVAAAESAKSASPKSGVTNLNVGFDSINAQLNSEGWRCRDGTNKMTRYVPSVPRKCSTLPRSEARDNHQVLSRIFDPKHYIPRGAVLVNFDSHPDLMPHASYTRDVHNSCVHKLEEGVWPG